MSTNSSVTCGSVFSDSSRDKCENIFEMFVTGETNSSSTGEVIDSYEVSDNDSSEFDKLSAEAARPASTDSEVIVDDELELLADAADMS